MASKTVTRSIHKNNGNKTDTCLEGWGAGDTHFTGSQIGGIHISLEKPQSGSKWKTYRLYAMILHSQFNLAFQFRRILLFKIKIKLIEMFELLCTKEWQGCQAIYLRVRRLSNLSRQYHFHRTGSSGWEREKQLSPIPLRKAWYSRFSLDRCNAQYDATKKSSLS